MRSGGWGGARGGPHLRSGVLLLLLFLERREKGEGSIREGGYDHRLGGSENRKTAQKYAKKTANRI